MACPSFRVFWPLAPPVAIRHTDSSTMNDLERAMDVVDMLHFISYSEQVEFIGAETYHSQARGQLLEQDPGSSSRKKPKLNLVEELVQTTAQDWLYEAVKHQYRFLERDQVEACQCCGQK